MGRQRAASRNRSFDDVLATAKQLHMKSELAEAEQLYAVILKAQPSHAEALHYAGILAHQKGRSGESVAMMAKSLAMSPSRADWHSNFGNVLQRQKKPEEAIAAYRRSLALEPKHVHAHNNLGVLLRLMGKPAESEEAYRAAIRNSPEFADAHHNLAVLLNNLGRTKEAIASFVTSLSLKANNPEARRKLAIAYCNLGQIEKAVEVCRQWVAMDPSDPLAQHALASVSGQQVPLRAADAYVEKIFDNFAKSFETQLAKLEYQAPSLVASALAGLGLPENRTLDVVDAGCGTGLCGPLISPYARRLTGVDLSDGMLHHAREKAVYDELVKAELTAFLRAHTNAFDLAVSADTLVYFGDLDEVFKAAAGALRPGGYLAFTVEESEEDHASPTYSIKPHGRYNHRADYVEGCLVMNGFEAQITRAPLRTEGGLPVDGLVVTAKKA